MQCISYDSSTLVAIMACTAPLTQDLLHYTHHINIKKKPTTYDYVTHVVFQHSVHNYRIIGLVI